MISWHDLYVVLTAVVPLYVAMILAYGSVRWWKIFTPDQCSGINRFVAVFAVPLLSFNFISKNDIYAMNFRFIAADTLQKLIMLVFLGLWANFTKNGSLEWSITIFSLSTLPNTLVMGIPLLVAMYGEYSGSLMVQIVVLQCIIWYTLLLFLFEYRGAKMLIMEQFPETAASIVSIEVESDVVSLDAQDFLETDAEIRADGSLHVSVRKSSASRRSYSGMTDWPSNLTGTEIYSLRSSRNLTTRVSNFNNSDINSMKGFGGRLSNFGSSDTGRMSSLNRGDMFFVQSSRGLMPRSSSLKANCAQKGMMSSQRFLYYQPGAEQPVATSYPAPNPYIALAMPKTVKHNHQQDGKTNHEAKELNMFAQSTRRSSDVGSRTRSESDLHVPGEQSWRSNQNHGKEISFLFSDNLPQTQYGETEAVAGGDDERRKMGPIGLLKPDSNSTAELDFNTASDNNGRAGRNMPPASVITRLILIMVWRKLTRNPNTYSSLIGLIWSLVSFRWHVHMPKIIEQSIAILSNTGLGMAMFSLGLFMALQPKLVACGKRVATFAMLVRFLISPAVMAVASIAVGLRGTLLRVAIVQAALPQGIVPFVFAKEYNVHPVLLSTAVIFGMLVALPITLIYYILIGL